MSFQHDRKIFVTEATEGHELEVQTQLKAETKILADTNFSANVDRTFELPKGLYIATVGIYLTYLLLMGAAFQADHMVVIIGICMISVCAGFGVPALWAIMQPDNDSMNMTWQQFVRNGIETHTGVLTAKDATIQMMILPVLVLAWGMACVIIAALV